MANLADVMEKYTKEEFSPLMRDALIEVSPLFKMFQEKWIGVERSGIGRDWIVKHLFVTSYAGAVRAEPDIAIEGDDIAYTGAGGSVFSPTATWPGISESVIPAFLWKTLQLKRWKGNLFMSHDLMRGDQLTAAMTSMANLTLKQSARNFAHQRANNFLASSKDKLLAQAHASTAPVMSGANNCIATITLSTTSRPRRLQPGMLVDVIDKNAGAYDRKCNAAKVVIVKSVDPLANVAVVEQIDQTAWAYDPGVDDYIVLRGSYTVGASRYGHGPYGLLEWMVDSGTIFNIDLAVYPQFKSKITAVSAALTDTVLRKELGAYQDAKAVDQWPDTILCTPGVLADYVAEVQNATVDKRTVEVNGEVITRRGGFASGTSYEYDGRTLPFVTDSLFPSGYAVCAKLNGGNIKRYVPPPLPGTGSNGQFAGDVEFVAPLGGSKGIWMHALNANAELTPYVGAPWEMIEEYCPEVLPALVLTGCTQFAQ